MERRPLGAYEAFAEWAGHPRSWGPDHRWQVWFAGGVIDGLLQVLDEHIACAQRRSRCPAVIGCSPWLKGEAVVDRLLKTACCVVIDKGAAVPPDRLARADCGFPNVLPGLRNRYPADADGGPLVIGPSTPKWEHTIGPIRLTGWRGPGGKPLAHAKLLVLGELFWPNIDRDDEWYDEETVFEATSLWWGSANLTDRPGDHLEVGFWCDDPELLRSAVGFMDVLLAFSEPADSSCAGPEPNLLRVEWDDDAMWEAVADGWPGQPQGRWQQPALAPTTDRAMALERLDVTLRALWPLLDSDDPLTVVRAAGTVVRVEERRAKLEGTDAPTRVDAAVAVGAPWRRQEPLEVVLARVHDRLYADDKPPAGSPNGARP
jgi:hypothetical protein